MISVFDFGRGFIALLAAFQSQRLHQGVTHVGVLDLITGGLHSGWIGFWGRCVIHDFLARRVLHVHSLHICHCPHPIVFSCSLGEFWCYRLCAGLRTAGKRRSDRQCQFRAGLPIISNRFKIALIGVVFLLPGADQLEDADEHVIRLLLHALDNALAEWHQLFAVQLDPAARVQNLGVGERDRIAGFEFQGIQICLGKVQDRLRPPDAAPVLIEDRQLQRERGAGDAAAVRIALGQDADIGVAEPTVGPGDGECIM